MRFPTKLCGLSLFLAFVPSARADFLDDLGVALFYAGFDVRGDNNPLSGGADLLVTTTFDGDPFDFGTTDLTLQGPISLQVSTGGRFLPQFEVSLTTAVDNRGTPVPLSYELTNDWGPQSTSISGTTLIDADFSLNGLGFYELTLNISSRQTVEREGLVNEESMNDADIGPITLSGNVFTDVLAALTDPFYEQRGAVNPFATLASSARLIDFPDHGNRDLIGAALSEAEQTMARMILGSLSGQGFEWRQWPSSNPVQRWAGAVVPEPPVVIFLLLGIPALVGRSLLKSRLSK